MKRTAEFTGQKVRERGDAMVEAVVSMLLICFVLFLLVQLAFLIVARESSAYASFRATRSLAVGFSDEEAFLEGHVKAIPGSGARVFPSPGYGSIYSKTDAEKEAIKEYLTGTNMLCYEFWGNGDDGVEHIDTGISNADTRLVVDFLRKTFGSSRFVSSRAYFIEYPLTKFMFSDAVSEGDPYYTFGSDNKYFLPAYYQDYLRVSSGGN